MGYYMYSRGSNFKFKEDVHTELIVSAIKSLKGKLPWVTDEELDSCNDDDLNKALNVCGWDYSEYAHSMDFIDEKSGGEDLLFENIARFVEDGSYIEMIGEDDYMWRWVFKSGTVREVTPNIIW